jgi:hypothetical protein
MNRKNWIRTLVLAGIVAWPAYETYQYRVAQREVAESEALRESVEAKLAAARVKYAQAKIVANSATQN